MYCPNCGVEIHEEGAFCAKCRKDVAYLTKPEEPEEKAPDVSEQGAGEALADGQAKDTAESKPKVRPEKSAPFKPQGKGYYCNYCGTFLYPEDNYCYDCGKTTRKKFYPQEKKADSNLRLFIAAGAIVLLGVVSACLYWYMNAE